MKLKDIEGALNLVAAFANHAWVEEHLKALLEAKVIADKAIAEQKELRAKIDAANEALGRKEASIVQAASNLEQRELRLKDAEEQHQFKMEQDVAGLAAQEKRLNERYEAMNAEHVKQCEARAKESEVLDRREKELTERQRLLTAAERTFQQLKTAFEVEAQVHADKVKKLRELTA